MEQKQKIKKESPSRELRPVTTSMLNGAQSQWSKCQLQDPPEMVSDTLLLRVVPLFLPLKMPHRAAVVSVSPSPAEVFSQLMRSSGEM